jgi:hypothetical protein
MIMNRLWIIFCIAPLAACSLNTTGSLKPGDAAMEPDLPDGVDLDVDSDITDIEVEGGCLQDRDCSDGNPCNGIELCEPTSRRCIQGSVREDGTLCGDGPRQICLAQVCVESICGDLFVDRGADEFCDDGNDDPADGCNQCRLSCTGDAECADEDECNGSETCDFVEGVCRNGTALADGTACGADAGMICLGGMCVASTCGDGFIDEAAGEECEGDATQDCTTPCTTAGLIYCGACRWGECVPPAEICNGADDDCNGLADEAFPCSQNAAGTACTTTCGTTGSGVCTPDCSLPAPSDCAPPGEVCNGADDNCDGAADETFPCVLGQTGLGCTTTCGSTGTGACSDTCQLPGGATCTPPAETCNGADDDCDGQCDNGSGCCANTSGSCTTSCGSGGTRTCSSGCAWGACQPPAETCNGTDDDCDGTADNGFECVRGSTTSCTASCGTTGTRTCSGTCRWGSCTPPAETCNGIDDDCDSNCDDGWACCAGRTSTCTTSCGTTGTRTCSSSCAWGSCIPPAETCNGIDDDCNGTRDDGYACYVGQTDSTCLTCGGLSTVTGSRTCGTGCTWGACCSRFEYCNSCDDDCNGAVDETGATSLELRVTNDSSSSIFPSMAYSASALQYGIVWRDGRAGNNEIYFARVSETGTKVGSDIRETNNTYNSSRPSIAANGSGYAVAWTNAMDSSDNTYEVFLATLNADGTGFTQSQLTSGTNHWAAYPSLVFASTEYGITWVDDKDGNNEIYFARYDLGRTLIGSQVRVTNESHDSFAPSLAFGSTQYRIAWDDTRDGNREIYTSAVDLTGTVTASVRVTNASGTSAWPALAFNISGYGVGWIDSRSGSQQLYFAGLAADGTKTVPDTQLSPAYVVDSTRDIIALIWDGTGYGAAWTDDRDGNSEIYFARLTAAGTILSPEERITSASGTSTYPTLSWNGSQWALAWYDSRNGNNEIYFTILGCVAP